MAGESSQSRQAIRLHLDSPTRVYRPGDNISGTLEVTKAAKVPSIVLQGVEEVTIKEEGKIQLGNRPNRTIILWQNVPCEEAAASTVASTEMYSTFTFKMTIPLNSQHVPSLVPIPKDNSGERRVYWRYPDAWDNDSRFFGKSETAAPLPPTCKFGARSAKMTLECEIEYAITVIDLPVSTRKVDAKKKARSIDGGQYVGLAFECFWLMPLLSPARPLASGASHSEYITHYDNYKRLQFSDTRLAIKDGTSTFIEPKPSFLRRMSSGSRTGPEAAFGIKLIHPRMFRLGEAFQLDVELEPIETDVVRRALASGKGTKPSITPVPMPDVELSSAKLELMCKTYMRVGTCLHENWDQTLFTLAKPSTALETGSDERDVQTGILQWSAAAFSAHLGTTGLSPLWVIPDHASAIQPHTADESSLRRRLSFDVPIPDRLAPTFKSFSVARTYRWGLTLNFKCAGQVQRVYYRLPDTDIHPSDTAEPPLDWGSYRLQYEGKLLYEAMQASGIDHPDSKWEKGSIWVAHGIQTTVSLLGMFM